MDQVRNDVGLFFSPRRLPKVLKVLDDFAQSNQSPTHQAGGEAENDLGQTDCDGGNRVKHPCSENDFDKNYHKKK